VHDAVEISLISLQLLFDALCMHTISAWVRSPQPQGSIPMLQVTFTLAGVEEGRLYRGIRLREATMIDSSS